MPIKEEIFAAMRLDPGLAIAFFATFARFEYALLASGCVLARDNGSAAADWGEFVHRLSLLDANTLTPIIAEGPTLLADPPKKLLYREGRVFFAPVTRSGQSDIRFLIEGVKRVRNNMFHGGKFVGTDGATARNAILTGEGLAVLQAILEVPSLDDIRRAYGDLPAN